MRITAFLIVAVAVLYGGMKCLGDSPPQDLPDAAIDLLSFGDADSERGHGLKTERSEAIQGGLSQPARRLLAGGPNSWEGGSLEWKMNVDPQKQNYLTVKLWGSDKGHQNGRLILFAEGLQVGYRHESDHDLLNQLDDDASLLAVSSMSRFRFRRCSPKARPA